MVMDRIRERHVLKTKICPIRFFVLVTVIRG